MQQLEVETPVAPTQNGSRRAGAVLLALGLVAYVLCLTIPEPITGFAVGAPRLPRQSAVPAVLPAVFQPAAGHSHALRATARAAVRLAAAEEEFEECIVNAENAGEIAACGEDLDKVKLEQIGLEEFEDCIVNAENAAEIADCSAPSPPSTKKGYEGTDLLQKFANGFAQMFSASKAKAEGKTYEEYEECIVNAENAAEISDCGVAPAKEKNTVA